LRLLLSVPAGGEGAASSVAGGQDHGRLVYRRPCQNPVLHRCVTGRLVSGYSLPPPAPPTRVLGGWLGPNVLWSPV